MLKTNEQLLQEKIEYATNKIAQYQARISLINEAIYDNRRIIDGILQRRLNKKVIIDTMTLTVARITTPKPNDSEAKYEKALKEENVELAVEIEKLEEKIKEFENTKANLSAILNKTKKKDKTREK